MKSSVPYKQFTLKTKFSQTDLNCIGTAFQGDRSHVEDIDTPLESAKAGVESIVTVKTANDNDAKKKAGVTTPALFQLIVTG
jgi:hypothetical protein